MHLDAAVLAVLVQADVGLSADELARNFDSDTRALKHRLKRLSDEGHVECDGDVFYASETSRPKIVRTDFTRRAASVD